MSTSWQAEQDDEGGGPGGREEFARCVCTVDWEYLLFASRGYIVALPITSLSVMEEMNCVGRIGNRLRWLCCTFYNNNHQTIGLGGGARTCHTSPYLQQTLHLTEAMGANLPTELWLWVLKLLGFSDLKAISSTCQRLRAVARPQLFRRLHLQMYERYDNLTLDLGGIQEIAPVVREFSFTYIHTPGLQHSAIKSVFTLLRQFPVLQTIRFLWCSIDAFIVQEVEQLPALTTVYMYHCDSSSLHPTCLRIKTLQFHRSYELRPDDITSWPFTIQPELLQCLRISNADLPTISSLPNLRTFSAEITSNEDFPTRLSDCLSFLKHCACPSLKTLVLKPDGAVETIVVGKWDLPVFPNLEIYHGPNDFVTQFASGASFLHVTSYGIQGESPEDRASILHQLHALAPNLVELAVDILLEGPILHAACLFPHLEYLCLNLYSAMRPAEACIPPLRVLIRSSRLAGLHVRMSSLS
jgi:hypothetical protein